MTTTSPSTTRRPEPALAAFLAFLWPGLGHAYLGRPGWAAVFALPVLALAAYVGVQLLGGAELFALKLFDPSIAVAVLVWILLLGLWRIAAIGHVYLLGPRARPLVRGAGAALLVAVVAMHGVAAYYAWAFYEAGSAIFEPPGRTPPVAGATPTPGPSLAPGVTPGPTATPRPPTNRITFLLTGVDSGHDRSHALTDTLLVLSVDTVDKTGVMISIPRDIARFPMYSGGTFDGKINSLLTAARLDPAKYPDGPMGTLTREVGFLIGIDIDYYAELNLDGFERMINLVGGVDVDNPKWIRDPRYDWLNGGPLGFQLSPGTHHLDGRTALAYVRSRQGIGDNDFTRARRQQEVIVSLRDKVTSPAVLPKLPDILKVAGQTISTDFPADQVSDYVALAQEIGDERIRQGLVLGPPYAYRPSQPSSTYVLLLDMDAVAKLSTEVFGTDSNYYALDTEAAP